ncbi:MAG: hypothetical protein V7749_08265 [Cocleimonas sp.]
MEYILFIHKNTDSASTSQQWDEFFIAANESDLFVGGSEIANQVRIGDKPVRKITDYIGGFMRFKSKDKNILLELLKKHPVVMQGGTIELCEMPKSENKTE